MCLVVTQNDHTTCDFAKSELEHYLLRMGNPDITITLKVQNPADEGMEAVASAALDDQYCIRITPDDKTIVGNNPRALLLAVYRYLFLVGCRFLRPGKRFEIIPTYGEVQKFYAQEKHTAALRHRGMCIEGTDSIENIADMLDWLPKAGYNSFFFQFKTPHLFLKRWYESNTKGDAQWREGASEHLLKYFNRLMEERGLLRHRMGHGWTAEVIGAKNTSDWESETLDIAEDVKSMIAEVNGKRELMHGVAVDTNLCLSNPAALDRFAQTVWNYIAENPDTEYLHIWLADGQHNFCECPACKPLRPADQYIVLLNRIDEILTEKKSDVHLCLLIYQDLFWPPISKKLNNPERFTLMFAPIHRTFNSSYREVTAAPTIPSFELNKTKAPTDISSNLAFLSKWKEVVSCDSFAYDYHLGRAHHSEPSHFKIAKIIYNDLHTYDRMKLNGIISCQELRVAFPNALPNYLMGQASLDLEKGFDEIAMDYYISCYGNYGKELYDKMDRLSALFDLDYVNYFCPIPRENPSIVENMSKALDALNDIQDLILKEKTNTNTNTTQAYMWRELEFFVAYARLFSKIILLNASGSKQNAMRIFNEELIPLIQAHEQTDQSSLDVSRVIHTINRSLQFN